jgi:hypothetical protein
MEFLDLSKALESSELEVLTRCTSCGRRSSWEVRS